MPRGLQTESVSAPPEYAHEEEDGSAQGHVVASAMHYNYSAVHTGSDQGHDDVDQAVAEMRDPDADDVPLTPIAVTHAAGFPRAKGSSSRRGKGKEMADTSPYPQLSSAGVIRAPSMRERNRGSILTLPRSVRSTNSSLSHHHDENDS